MQVKLMMPQEIEVMYIIPAVRSYLAVYMKQAGKPQKEIAHLLNIQESTVSQYISKKRGCQIKLSKDIQDDIKKSAAKVKSFDDSRRYIQIILKKIRTTKEICLIHGQLENVKCECPLKKGCVY